jgi:hypothetical protein
MEGSSVKLLRVVPAVTAALALCAFSRAAAQAQTATPRLAGCAVNCYSVVFPYGSYVREVKDGGGFVTLEDGSSWEIRLPQRPVASGWQPGDFVQLKNIAAPVDGFEILLTHGDFDKAEARLAGRAKLPD